MCGIQLNINSSLETLVLKPFNRTFNEFLESRKIFEKSSHGPKLSEKCYEKVDLVQVKKFLILKS